MNAKSNGLQRRTFLSTALAAASCAALGSRAGAKGLSLAIGSGVLATMPGDFTGLSYESPQLYNPDYFSPANTALVAAFKGLGRKGVLRLGGNLSDVTRWKSQAGDFTTPAENAILALGKDKWEWKLTDPKVAAAREGAITPLALARLGAFLDATGWDCIYGLNYGSGSPQRARDEAAHVAAALGQHLIAFQVGNEPDQFPRYKIYGDKAKDFDSFYADYPGFVAAVRQAVPRAPFAGPDTALRMDWVKDFAKREGKNAALLTSHIYHMGPARNPAMNAEVLLNRKSRLEEQIAQAREATALSGVPFRLTEVNSCTGGGRVGVSDAFASALWGADMMLQTAAGGYAGVNLHGGGDGGYTPIAVGADGGVEKRPLYFGMQFAGYFAGAALLPCQAETDANVRAYAAKTANGRMLALINKGPEDVAIAQQWLKPKKIVRLTAPSLDAKTGVTVKTYPAAKGLAATLPGYSASILIGV
jgi:hypothetical protein